MKSFEEIIASMDQTIQEAVHCESEEGSMYLVIAAQKLGAVVGLDPDEVDILYQAEMIREFVIKHGRETGVLG